MLSNKMFSTEKMQKLNTSIVLNIIRKNRGISRKEIADISGLTQASITQITNRLMKEKIIIEVGIGESNGGRPPIRLEINPDFANVIGVNFSPGYIEIVLMNIEMKIIHKFEQEIAEDNPEKLLNMGLGMVDDFMKSVQGKTEGIIGIGIACTGIVDIENGVSVFAPFYGWKNLKLKEIFEKRYGKPVYVENDVRAMALSESMFGAAFGIEDFIEVNISNGIGAGIMLNNEIYFGADYSAGEIGHIPVVEDGIKCNCGNYGCLTTVSSNMGMVAKAVEEIKTGRETLIKEMVKGELEHINMDIFCKALKKYDKMAVEIAEEAAGYIGAVLSDTINILNIKNIIFTGEIIDESQEFIDSITKALRKRISDRMSYNLRVIKSEIGHEAAVIGAATLVVRNIFAYE